MLKQTPSQTVGPFFHVGLVGGHGHSLVNDDTRGRKIIIRGVVRDGNGDPVPDAMIEIWQADAEGIYRHPADPRRQDPDPNFAGFGRAATDDDGRYRFHTVKPGRSGPDPETGPAPHINLHVFARGLLIHAMTRLYFQDEPSNQQDPILNSVEVERRKTLIASPAEDSNPPAYCFDIVLQGEGETVFFSP